MNSIHPSIQSLFEYTAKAVTDQDIKDFCPVDPGYPDYCREMTRIRDEKKIPAESNFDIRETINLVGWAKPSDYKCPEDFRRFRRFTTSLGMGLEHRLALQGYSSGEVREIYFLSFELLSEVDRADPKHLSLVRLACEAARNTWAANLFDIIDDKPADGADEFDFQCVDDGFSLYTFGMLYLAQLSKDWSSAEKYATLLICDIHEGEYPASPITQPILRDHEPKGFPSLYRDWDSLFCQLANPTNHKDTQIVIDALSRPRS